MFGKKVSAMFAREDGLSGDVLGSLLGKHSREGQRQREVRRTSMVRFYLRRPLLVPLLML